MIQKKKGEKEKKESKESTHKAITSWFGGIVQKLVFTLGGERVSEVIEKAKGNGK